MSTHANPYHVSEVLLGLSEDMVRRKGTQMGSIRRKGPSYTVTFSTWVKTPDGNLVWKAVERVLGRIDGKGRITEKQAQRLAYELVSKANQLNAMPQGFATVAQFIETRFQSDHVHHLKKSGRIHYRTMLNNHVLPTFGNVQIRELTPQMVQSLVNAKLQAGLSIQTVTHIRNVISAVMRHARNLGFFQGQLPTEAISLPEMAREERRSMTWLQVLALADAMPRKHRALILLLGQAGLRIGEAAGLRWKDVNLTDDYQISDGDAIPPNSIIIRSNWTKGERTSLKGRNTKPKVVPLTSTTWVELSLHLEMSKFNGPDHPVFASHNGTPLDGHNVGQRSLKAAGAKIGCPWVSWHCLRHTASTLAETVGVTAAEKQKLFGWKTAAMSIHYSHPEADAVRTKLEKIQ